MHSPAARRHLIVCLAYLALACAYAWPLPAHMSTALPGEPSGDTGVYAWNLWVFRHELVEHHRFPFFTFEILTLASPTPLTLHNYTTFANLLAFFALPVAGIVRTYNGILILSTVASAYAMYLLARRRTGDEAAAWLAGAAFGFSPFLMARFTSHFSLVQAAPLPIFALVLLRLYQGGSWRVAAVAGGVVAWAYLSDPYYAVYCMLMLLFMIGYSIVNVQLPELQARWRGGAWAIDLAILCVAGLVAGILIRGGGRVDMFGLRVSMRSLYTPVLVLTLLIVVRAVVTLRPRLRWRAPAALLNWRLYFAASVTGLVFLAPILYTMAAAATGADSLGAPVLWRSSARGMDLLAVVAPNPLHPWLHGVAGGWLAGLPGGFTENVASIPWTIIGFVVTGAAIYRIPLPRAWMVWTGCFLLLSLGPFIYVAGWNTHVPTPWTLLRYVPVIGAARMPTRFGVLVAMGAAMIFCLMLAEMRKRSRRPRVLASVAGALLIFELLPAPRQVFPATPPKVIRTIAADPRPLRVLNLPFGVRDGLSSEGNYTALSQFYQTFHEKPLIGGYLSRLPRKRMGEYRRSVTLRALMKMSGGDTLSPEELARAVRRAPRAAARFRIGWVLMDRARTPEHLASFARRAFNLQLIESAEGYDLYAVPQLDAAPSSPGS